MYLGAELSKVEANGALGKSALISLGFAGIAILAAIETVVRGILTIPALTIYCCLPEDLKERVWIVCPFGTVLSIATIISSCLMIYNLVIGALFPCLASP